MTMHYRHYFSAAGHGTFFFGSLRNDEQKSSDAFTWVYDCGSLRKSHLKGLVSDFHDQMQDENTLDMVCLSHFDSDHVSGLDLLLEHFRVDTLVLPYVPLEVRLRLASELSEEMPGAAGLATYTLDPVFYLAERGLGNGIERLAFIQGRSQDGASESGVDSPFREEEGDEQSITNGPRLQRSASRPLNAQDGYGSAANRQVEVYSDADAWCVNNIYEFVFYSKSWPDDCSPKSGTPLAQIALLARAIITDYKLLGSGTPEPGWLAALQALYDEHFGKTYKRRNEISLCVFGAARAEHGILPCKIFQQSYPANIALGPTQKDKHGILLTGDAYLNPTELQNLMAHLGKRSHHMGLLQVPHHGSSHNWSPGNALKCSASHYVICAPGTSKHPGALVKNDLPSYALADYVTTVSFDYHDNEEVSSSKPVRRNSFPHR